MNTTMVTGRMSRRNRPLVTSRVFDASMAANLGAQRPAKPVR